MQPDAPAPDPEPAPTPSAGHDHAPDSPAPATRSGAYRSVPARWPSHRVERLIAAGRAVLAAFSLLAVWLDPAPPQHHAEIAHALLLAYTLYATALLPVVWSGWQRLPRLGLITHALDLAVISVVMHYTEGPTSPFFVYFVFSLVCATMRWQVRGTLWTLAVAITLFVAQGAYAALVENNPNFELQRFVIRCAYLCVVAVLLTYLGLHEQRKRVGLWRIATWPRTMPRELDALSAHLLDHARRALGADHALLIWDEPDEPWRCVAHLDAGRCGLLRAPPTTMEPAVASALADANFLVEQASAPAPRVLVSSATGPRPWCGPALHPELRARLQPGVCLVLPLPGEAVSGWLLVHGLAEASGDELTLGELVARLVCDELERHYNQAHLAEMALSAERSRLAHDLHDSQLQAFAAVGLQIEAARRLLAERPAEAETRLREAQALLLSEQRGVRAFVRAQLQGGSTLLAGGGTLRQRLELTAAQARRRWGMHVELEIAEPLAPPLAVSDQLVPMVSEALNNAGRHGRAHRAHVQIQSSGTHLAVRIADNGAGFPFHGRYGLTDLVTLGIGPVSLRQRASALGGTLELCSTPEGSTLDLTLPATMGGGTAEIPA